jgi:hypothetical protein
VSNTRGYSRVRERIVYIFEKWAHQPLKRRLIADTSRPPTREPTIREHRGRGTRFKITGVDM